jgi:o-succinylbenzoate---CoA ligase
MEFATNLKMNHESYHSFLLNGRFYQKDSLHSFCEQKLANNHLAEWEQKLYQFILSWISADPFVEVKTSGSTGAPKWIRIEKDRMIKSALMTGEFFNLKKTGKALLCLPVDFIAGKMMVVRSFVPGLDLITVEPSGNPLDKFNDDIDFAAMTPYQAGNIFTKENGTEKLNKIRKLIIGGSDIQPYLLNKIRLLKNETWQTYGMTETITHVAVRKLNPPGETEFFQALPGVSFEQDERNCLVIQAPHLNGSKTITNDIVKLKNKGEFKFIGRFDNIINSGGIKLSPEEIETKLNPYIHQRFIIAGFPDKKLGQKVVLIIEMQDSESIDLKKLAEQSNLSRYEIPRQVIFSTPFPLTENGKIQRKQVLNNCQSKLQ